MGTVEYPVLEIEARVAPFENGGGFSLRAMVAREPSNLKPKATPPISEPASFSESFSKTFSRGVSMGSHWQWESYLILLGKSCILVLKIGHEPPDSDPRPRK